MTITDRQKDILEKLIGEYIKLAWPISSDFLKKECHLSISPATIRLDLADLTRAGFLEKHYISGGRIPTDRGWRFFVDNLFEKDDFAKNGEKILKEFEEIFKEVNDIFHFSQEIAKRLASFSANLGLVYSQELGVFWKEGWEKIVKIPEFQNLDYLKKFTELVNDLERNIEKFDFFEKGEKIKVYIGKESPFKEKKFGIVAGKSLERTTFVILGPKRMDYNRNIGLINYLIKKIEKI